MPNLNLFLEQEFFRIWRGACLVSKFANETNNILWWYRKKTAKFLLISKPLTKRNKALLRKELAKMLITRIKSGKHPCFAPFFCYSSVLHCIVGHLCCNALWGYSIAT
jgi:hypothetical protein